MSILASRQQSNAYGSYSGAQTKKSGWSLRRLLKNKKEIRKKKLGDDKARFMDYKLLITLVILCSFGLIMVYSSSAYTAASSSKQGYNEYYFLIREAIFMALGFAAMFLISRFDYHIIKGWMVWGFYFLTILLLCITDFTPMGVEINGQKRWLYVIPFIKKGPTYQPSEFAKVAVILLMAYMVNRVYVNINTIRVCAVLVILVGIPSALVLIKNLSTGIIVFGIGFGMYFIAGKWKKIYALGVTAVLAMLIVLHTWPDVLLKIPLLHLKSYQIERITVWADPSSDPLNTGYQVLQGLYAIGSGGWFGKGLGNSIQKINFIPESYNDMIFSIICEELGVFGAFCLLALFAYLIYRLMNILTKAPDLYGAMIVAGVMVHIGLQVILNVCVVTNVLPNTGVTMPFISYGGTSVAILLAEMGLVLSVGRQIIYSKE